MLQGCLWPPGVITDLHSRAVGASRGTHILLHHTKSEFLSFLPPLVQQQLLGKLLPHSGWEIFASFLFFQFFVQHAGGLAAVVPGSLSLSLPLNASITTNLF